MGGLYIKVYPINLIAYMPYYKSITAWYPLLLRSDLLLVSNYCVTDIKRLNPKVCCAFLSGTLLSPYGGLYTIERLCIEWGPNVMSSDWLSGVFVAPGWKVFPDWMFWAVRVTVAAGTGTSIGIHWLCKNSDCSSAQLLTCGVLEAWAAAVTWDCYGRAPAWITILSYLHSSHFTTQ